jgi:hypothetical protein
MMCKYCNIFKSTNYDLCNKCIGKFTRVCICNKKYNKQKPNKVFIKNDIPLELDASALISSVFTQLDGNIYQILACGGCKYNQKEIDNDLNFSINISQVPLLALSKNILSCLFIKKIVDNIESFEYFCDFVNPEFDTLLYNNDIDLDFVKYPKKTLQC